MKKLISWLDPHKQSCFFFEWKAFTVLLIIGIAILLTVCWKSAFVRLLLDNSILYLPNYLTHEMAGHNFVGGICGHIFYSISPGVARWLSALAGNGVETLIPFCALVLLLRLEGGRWCIPPVLYWLSSTLYGAGMYASDAKACSFALTSSDMMTNYKPGEICGDWNHILRPLGILDYDQFVAYPMIFLGCLCFVLAIYSAWYYWKHNAQYLIKPVPDSFKQPDDWEPPNIYTPQ